MLESFWYSRLLKMAEAFPRDVIGVEKEEASTAKSFYLSIQMWFLHLTGTKFVVLLGRDGKH